jgi:hypothetical protein
MPCESDCRAHRPFATRGRLAPDLSRPHRAARHDVNRLPPTIDVAEKDGKVAPAVNSAHLTGLDGGGAAVDDDASNAKRRALHVAVVADAAATGVCPERSSERGRKQTSADASGVGERGSGPIRYPLLWRSRQRACARSARSVLMAGNRRGNDQADDAEEQPSASRTTPRSRGQRRRRGLVRPRSRDDVGHWAPAAVDALLATMSRDHGFLRCFPVL